MRKGLLTALIAGLTICSPAAAATTNAPSGNSGLSQYLEVVPGSGGNTPTKRGLSRDVLSAKARAALNSRGDTGRSLERFASSSSPATEESAIADEDPAGKVGALAASAGGGSQGALGVLLPILIVAGSLLAAFAAYRQRSSRQIS